MKFAINRVAMAAALAKLFAVTPAKSPKDVLRYVLVTANSDKMVQFEATNEEVSLRLEVPAEVEVQGALLLDQKMRQMCSEGTAETMRIEGTQSGLAVSCGLSDWTLPTEEPNLFPVFTRVDGEEVVIPSSEFRKAVDRTHFSADPTSMRYALGGIHIDLTADNVTFAATDGRRLSAHQIIQMTNHADGPKKCVVPLLAMRMAASVSEKCEVVSIVLDTHTVEFQMGSSILTSRLVEGRFPDYRGVIPSTVNFQFSLSAGPLHSGLRQAMIVTNEETRGMSFDFANQMLDIRSSKSAAGTSKIQIPHDSNEKFKTNLDPKFVVDLLRTIPDTEMVQMLAVSAGEAITFLNGSTTYVVMPLSE